MAWEEFFDVDLGYTEFEDAIDDFFRPAVFKPRTKSHRGSYDPRELKDTPTLGDFFGVLTGLTEANHSV